jgi:hypothetical protein
MIEEEKQDTRIIDEEEKKPLVKGMISLLIYQIFYTIFQGLNIWVLNEPNSYELEIVINRIKIFLLSILMIILIIIAMSQIRIYIIEKENNLELKIRKN